MKCHAGECRFLQKTGAGLYSGEDLFLARLQGHGTVYLQSLPFSRLADRIIQNAPSLRGAQKGEGLRSELICHVEC